MKKQDTVDRSGGFHGQATLLLTIILLILAAELLVLTACDGEALQSHRPPAAMVVDGAWNDWEEIPIHRVEEMNGLVIGVANDDDSLYLMTRTTDQRLVRRLRMLGIVVRASGKGKAGSSLVVRYHGSVALADSLPPPGGPGGDGPPSMPMELPEGADPGMIEIEQDDAVRTVAENRPDGPAAGSATTGDVYCYEFRLPITTLFAEPIPEGACQGRKIHLEVESGEMTKEMRRQMMPQMGSMDSRGGGGGRGGMESWGGRGGMGGKGGGMGGPGGMRGPGNRDAEPKKLKVTVELAGEA